MDQRIGVDGLGIERLLARKGEEPRGQRRGARGPVDRVLYQALVARVGLGHPTRQEVEATDDHREQVVEVMRDAASEAADGLHLLRLAQLFFDAGALCHLAFELRRGAAPAQRRAAFEGDAADGKARYAEQRQRG